MSYKVIVTREGTDWIAEAPEVPGAQTWARNLVVLERGIREAIAVALDIPEAEIDDIALDLQFDVDSESVRGASDVRAIRKQIAVLEEYVAGLSQQLGAKLAEEDYSVRDISVLLGISPGRVSQITAERNAAVHGYQRHLRTISYWTEMQATECKFRADPMQGFAIYLVHPGSVMSEVPDTPAELFEPGIRVIGPAH